MTSRLHYQTHVVTPISRAEGVAMHLFPFSHVVPTVPTVPATTLIVPYRIRLRAIKMGQIYTVTGSLVVSLFWGLR